MMRRYGPLLAVLISARIILLFLAFEPVLDSPAYFPARAAPKTAGPRS